MIKVGILGGGQLGRMLLQAAANYPVQTHVLENDAQCPAAHLCHQFTLGNITDYDAVFNFGKDLDAITIEIENVNAEALRDLEQKGVRVYPKPDALITIKNKTLQKAFYQKHNIPTAPFEITQKGSEVKNHPHLIPAIHKLGEGGYDGRGVQPIEDEKHFPLAFDGPSVLEKKIAIKKELAVMIAVNDAGEEAIFPVVDMIFDPALNLLSHQICPAQISKPIIEMAQAVALDVVRHLKSPGIFAVELFVDEDDVVWVNETAPRVHNSGHHTIEGNYCSQFDMLWRILLQYPPGNTQTITNSALINLVGENGYTGTPVYKGLKTLLAMDKVYVHLYGKLQTRGGRKMGHVTVLSDNINELEKRVQQVRAALKIIA